MSKRDTLLSFISRRDGSEIRLYRRLFKGHFYFELSTWAPETEGGHQIRALNIRRCELRPLALALVAACKELGSSNLVAQETDTENS
jgi:hypothetical protein